MLQRFEGQIEEVLAKQDAVTISLEDGERMYRLLGAYRGVSKTTVDCATSARAIDWDALRKARFCW
jgi:hypothetical protein